MGWGFDCFCYTVVSPGVGYLTDLVLPGEGIFEERKELVHRFFSEARVP